MSRESPEDEFIPAPLIPLEHTTYFSVEYPGYIGSGSLPKCFDRLGGLPNVSETFRRSLKIDLRLKDNQPFAHPVTGQTVATNNLVLKVVRRKKKRGLSPEQDTTDMEHDGASEAGGRQSKGQFTAQIVGVARKTIRFRNPADFQYHPRADDPVIQLQQAMHRLDVNYIASYRLPEEREDYMLSPEEQKKRSLPSPSNLRSFPSPLFTRYDMPMNYNFKPNPSSIQQTVVDKETGETSTRLVNSSRLRMQTPVSIKWGEPTPTTCGPERESLRPWANSDLLQKLNELLEKRPVWTRQGLLNQMTLLEARRMHNNKAPWALATYVFHEGPWRDSVIKLGYDPRQDPESVKYQIVSIRNTKNSVMRPSLLVAQTQETDISRDEHSHEFDGIHVRPAGTFQLCDVKDPLIVGLITEAINDPLEECNDKTGWLKKAPFERIRAIMKFKHQRLCDMGVAPTEEECTIFLETGEDVDYLRRAMAMDKQTRKRAKARTTVPEEELAARRLELAVSRMGQPEDAMELDG